MADMPALIARTLRTLDPERAHRLAIAGLKTGLAGYRASDRYPSLRTSVLGLDFPNPIGLAAGFDKNAEVTAPMLRLGFGFVEIGTVTPLPQAGNPKPRLFRDDQAKAIVNRLGFNGQGIDAVEPRLRQRPRTGIVGVNIGRNKLSAEAEADYVTGIRRLGPYADYLTVNISSPNTPGLRGLQEPAAFESLLKACVAARTMYAPGKPLLVKLAPDLDDEALRAVVEIAVAQHADGLILGNTTISRPDGVPDRLSQETGGLSGRPLFDLATDRLRCAYRVAGGRIPLVGVGGISTGADAFAKIRAGASLIQAYSGMIFDGPGFAARLAKELDECVRNAGFTSVAAAVGTAD